MIHQETFNAFVDGIKKIHTVHDSDNNFWTESIEKYVKTNDKDFYIYPNIPNFIIPVIRENFALKREEEILLFRDHSFWNSKNQGFVITDLGFTDAPYDHIPRHYYWKDISHVEFAMYSLYVYDKNSVKCFEISENDLSKNIDGLLYFWADVMNSMINTQKQKSHDEIYEEYNTQYGKLIEQGKESEALQVALDYRRIEKKADFSSRIAWLYHNRGEDVRALQILDEDIDKLDEDDLIWKSFLTYHKYSLYVENKDFLNARKSCLYVAKNAPAGLMNEDDISILEDATNDFQIYEDYYIQHFLEQPYNERKLIVPVQSYTDLSQKKLAVVDINNLPAINFPMGHPVANQLYVGHPYIPSKYIPFENYELELIEDKIREFSQIMQYLGATEINIESVNSSSNNKDVNTDQKLSGGADYKFISGSGNGERYITNKLLEDISQHINLHQKFSPKKTPMLPNNLVWYQNEPSWQRLYNQRMQGALLEHEERIETKKSQVVENSELKKISAEVKWLFVQANGNWEQSMEEKFEAHENAILSIHVKFAPLDSLGKTSVQDTIKGTIKNTMNSLTSYASSVGNIVHKILPVDMTDIEKEYLDELKACLEEDGEISSRERRLLNRLRERLGITEERAEELEVFLLNPQLTEEEQEYLDEYKICKEEGEISSREKRLLDKLRVKLRISEDRARELESSLDLN